MIIRTEQIARMEQAMQRLYHEQLRRVLRQRFPQLVARLDDRTLLDRITNGVKSAQAYRIVTGEGILAFVGLCIAAGPTFSNEPKIRHFFEVPGDSPDRKVEWLFKRVVEKLQGIAQKSAEMETES